jgi:hypothetical protein
VYLLILIDFLNRVRGLRLCTVLVFINYSDDESGSNPDSMMRRGISKGVIENRREGVEEKKKKISETIKNIAMITIRKRKFCA